MRVLFVYPKYPNTYWSFSGVLKFINKKAVFPPLGLLTIAAMVPAEWEKKLVDVNVVPLKDEDIIWADMIFISAMIVQKDDAISIIQRCKKFGKRIVAGGPLFTMLHPLFDSLGVDHFVLDEGEVTLPQFLADLELNTIKHIYRSSERPDITKTPIPLWSLININDYYAMMLQFSRGCPFNCEFCDIVIMNGRVPRTKTSEQVMSEFQTIYDLGYRGFFFIVDDNFIGNKIKVKELLKELVQWQKEKNYPFDFITEASLNLAEDPELLGLMRDANFKNVFLGIETPSIDSLKECSKLQNTKNDLVESVKIIQQHGIIVMGGFIVGFDSDTQDIFDAQIEFIQKTGITTAMVGMLGALPGTRLWDRLKHEGRLLKVMTGENTDGTVNFIPKMGLQPLISGYARVLKTIYSPKFYYKRISTLVENYIPSKNGTAQNISKQDIKIFLKVAYMLGIKSHNRFRFWKLFIKIIRNKPESIHLAVEQAIYGHHFEIVTKKALKTIESNKNYNYEPLTSDLIELIENPRKNISKNTIELMIKVTSEIIS